MTNLQLFLPIAFKNATAGDQPDKLILAGDIGGTKANMLLSRLTSNGLETIRETQNRHRFP